MKSTIFVVGLNDNGTYYPVVHRKSCHRVVREIRLRGVPFTNIESALCAATEHRMARGGCTCKKKTEEELGRPLP